MWKPEEIHICLQKEIKVWQELKYISENETEANFIVLIIWVFRARFDFDLVTNTACHSQSQLI